MKRKISMLLLVAMLITSLSAFGVSAGDAATPTIKFYHNLNNSTDVSGKNTSNIKIENASLKLQTIKTGTSAGNDYNRRSMLFSLKTDDADSDGIIPVGTYTVSLMLRHNSAALSDWATYTANVISHIEMTFYGIGSSDDAIAMNNDCGTDLKLVPGGNGDFTMTSDPAVVPDPTNYPDRKWYKYTATLTLKEPCESIAFWVINETDTLDSNNFVTYIDDITLSGDPAEHASGMVYRGAQDSITADPADATANVLNVRLVTTLDVNTYSAAGIAVKITTAEGTKSQIFPITEAYTSLLGGTVGEGSTYKASYYNASSICALTLKNLPVTGEVKIEFEPYVGTREEMPNLTHTVTWIDGVYQGNS